MTVNPALADLVPLLGRWRMEVYNAEFLPTPESRVGGGSTEIDWIEDRCALRMRQAGPELTPFAVWIIGRDERWSEYTALYADDRGVSRVYEMTFEDGEWRMWRDAADFSQRFEAQLDADARVIRGRWEKSTDDGATWEHDFNVDYTLEV